MLDKPKFDPTKIVFVEFKMLKAQIESTEEFDMSAINGYDIDSILDLGFNLDGKLAKVDLNINLQSNSEGNNILEANGSFHFIFIYHIENLDDLIRKTIDNQIETSDVLGNALSSISYSTTRGILMTRLQSTVFQNCILPVIDPNKLLKGE